MLGKEGNTFVKQVEETRNLIKTGTKSVAFAHQSPGGETEINFNSLATPSGWALSGLGNPSGSYLQSLALTRFRKNFTITSSLGYVLQKGSYTVFNDRIEFRDYTSQPNEIFEVEVSDTLVGGVRSVNTRIIDVQGEFEADGTDILIGKEVLIDPEQVIVFLNGIQIFKNQNNAEDNSGNYFYLDPENRGRSAIIRLNETATAGTAFRVISIGGVLDDPQLSSYVEIEQLQGQLDAIVPTVAALAGVPETDFQAVPNNVHVQAFYRRMVNLARPYYVEVWSTNGQVFPNGGTPTKVQFNSVQENKNLIWNPATFEIEIPVGGDGIYHLDSSFWFDSNVVSGPSYVRVLKNGSDYRSGPVFTNGSDRPGSMVSISLPLVAGDTIAITLYQAVGSNQPLSSGGGLNYLILNRTQILEEV